MSLARIVINRRYKENLKTEVQAFGEDGEVIRGTPWTNRAEHRLSAKVVIQQKITNAL